MNSSRDVAVEEIPFVFSRSGRWPSPLISRPRVSSGAIRLVGSNPRVALIMCRCCSDRRLAALCCGRCPACFCRHRSCLHVAAAVQASPTPARPQVSNHDLRRCECMHEIPVNRARARDDLARRSTPPLTSSSAFIPITTVSTTTTDGFASLSSTFSLLAAPCENLSFAAGVDD